MTAPTVAERASIVGNLADGAELLKALLEIRDGLKNTGSVPGEWMTRIRKQDAYAIACWALAKYEAHS